MAFQLNLGAIGVDMTLNKTGFKSGVADAGKELDAAGKAWKTKLGKIGKAGALAFGAALTAGVAGAVAGITRATMGAADFEQAIVRAGAKAGATADELRGLEAAATKVGLDTAFSAQQAAEGLDFLAMAGLNASQQMEALPGIAQLATAGNLELADAADIATNILSGMGMRVEELSRVNDVLAKASTSANTSVSELGRGMSFAAPVAAGLGISLEETAAVMGKLSDAGIKGSRSGTSFTAAIKKLGDVAGELGVKFDNADLATKGYTGVLRELEAAGLTAANAMDLFGSEGGVGVAALLNQGIDSVDNLKTSLDNAGGAAQKLVDKELDTLAGQMTILRGTVETTANAFGKQLLPILKPVTKQMVASATAVGENITLLEAFRQTAVAAARIIGDFIIGLAALVEVSTALYNAFLIVSKPFRFIFVELPLNGIKVIGAFVSALATGLLGTLTLISVSAENVARAFGNEGLAAKIREGSDALVQLTDDAAEMTASLAKDATVGFVTDQYEEMKGALEGLTETNKGAAAEMREYGHALHEGAAASDAKAEADAKARKAAEMWQGPLDDTTDALDDQGKAAKRAKGEVEALARVFGTYGHELESTFVPALERAAAGLKNATDELKENERAAAEVQASMKAYRDAAAELQAVLSGGLMPGDEQKVYENAVQSFRAIAAEVKSMDSTQAGYNDKLKEATQKAKELAAAYQQARNTNIAGNLADQALGGGGLGALGKEAALAAQGLSSMASMTTAGVQFFADLWMSTKGMKEIFEKVGDVVDAAFGPFVDFISNQLVTALKPVLEILEALAPVLQVALFFMNPFIVGLKAIAEVVNFFVKPIKDFVSWLRRAVNSIDVAIRNIGRREKNKARVDEEGNIIDPKRREGITIIIDDSLLTEGQAKVRTGENQLSSAVQMVSDLMESAGDSPRTSDAKTKERRAIGKAARAQEEAAKATSNLTGDLLRASDDLVKFGSTAAKVRYQMRVEEIERRKGIEALVDFAKQTNVSVMALIGLNEWMDRFNRQNAVMPGELEVFGEGAFQGVRRRQRRTFGDAIMEGLEASRGRLAEAFDRVAESANDAASSMANVPEVFNANLRRFQAQSAGGGTVSLNQPTGTVQSGGNTWNIETLVVQANDPDALRRRLEELASISSGTPMGSRTANDYDISSFARSI